MKLKARITGNKVHDVGYRVFILDRAQELELSGFEAQNRKEDGSQVVFIFMEGDEQQIGQLRSFIEKETPPDAQVSAITFEDYQGHVLDIDKFSQRTNTRQLNKGINALLSIDKKQDKMLEKQDMMIEKQDVMIEKQDTTITVLKEVREDTSDIKNDISALRKDTSETLYEKYDQLSREIAEIKATLSEIKARAA